MKVTIFGAGALGSVIGGMMAESNAVTLICREDHARAINADGLRLDGLVDKMTYPHSSIGTAGLPVQDLVIVTVKAYDTSSALRSIGPLVDEDTSVLVIQNGLTIIRDVREQLPGAYIGTASLGAQYIGPGHVRLTGMGELVIGNHDRPNEGVLEALRSTGIVHRWSTNIQKDVWRKAVINSCINPLTALTRRTNNILVEDQGINSLARGCFEESYGVGRSTGHLKEGDMSFSDVEGVARATGMNRSSMLQDVERGKRTEIENINGEVVRLGLEKGCDVGINHVLVDLVSAICPSNQQID